MATSLHSTDPRKWILSLITLTCILGASLFIDPPSIGTQILGKLNRVVPDGLTGWSVLTSPNWKIQPLAVNLSSCHPAIGRPGKLVNCCPPRNMLDDPISDFEFPDPDTTPIRVRRFAHRLDDDYIAKYEKALSIMKSLPHSDPRSFTRQVEIHCQYCTGSFLQQGSDFPVRVHRNWLFFPWHRMFLYFHERILGSLIGDETFALPFWGWDSPDGMTLPELYLNGSFNDHRRDPSHYPPTVVDLNFKKLDPTRSTPEEQIRLNLALMYNHMVSGAKTAELFLGCPYKTGEYEECPGTIERAPHNPLHTWLGSPDIDGREDMGAFYVAARDPIFYAHHSNGDRLWGLWSETHKGFDDPAFLNSYTYFYDETLRLVRIRFSDVMEMDKLRYRYEEIENAWVAARPEPSVSPRLARREIRKREREREGNVVLDLPSSRFGPTNRVLDSTITIPIDRPREVWYSNRRNEKEREEILVVEGIDVKANDYVKFDVYINVVNSTILSPIYREFVGTFVDIPGGTSSSKKRTKLQLGISEALEDLEADQDRTIWVTLVPRTESCNQVTVDGLKINYTEK
ncbi:unnamed protein product [Linum trigynum]